NGRTFQCQRLPLDCGQRREARKRFIPSFSRHEFHYSLCNPILLIELELRIYRQGENLRCDSFRNGEIPQLISKGSISFLAMERHRIMDLCRNVSCEKI